MSSPTPRLCRHQASSTGTGASRGWLWQTAAGADSTAGEDAQTLGGAACRRCRGSLLVQFSHLARPGHRGPDVTARFAVLRGPGLNREDVHIADSQIQVLGKGKKIRVLPLTSESLDLLDHLLRLERPRDCGRPVRFSQRASPRQPHDTRRSAFLVPLSPATTAWRKPTRTGFGIPLLPT